MDKTAENILQIILNLMKLQTFSPYFKVYQLISLQPEPQLNYSVHFEAYILIYQYLPLFIIVLFSVISTTLEHLLNFYLLFHVYHLLE